MEDKKQYIVITPFFPSKESYIGSYIYDQINEIKNQSDFNIRVIKVVSLFSSEIDYEYKGFKVSILKMLDVPFFIFPGLFNFINKRRVLSLLNKEKINAISCVHGHVTYPSAFLSNCIADEFKCKSIVQHHGLDVLQLMNGRNKFLRKLQRSYVIRNGTNQLNKVNLNIGVSDRVLSELNTFTHYMPKAEYVLYNGVDTSKFFPIEMKNNKYYTIGCVANFWKIKDQITLIKAIELLILEDVINLKLRLIGEGEELERCKKYVKEKGLERYVFFENEMPHDKLNTFYNELDLFVLPSYYEALGCVYLESWATNTPFIGVEFQGVSEIIASDEKNNLLVKSKSPKILKDKILAEYNKNRIYVFNQRYNIKNTISEFIENYF
jgi:glycosyltransferase involved in cell wall biosynthesis